MKNTKRYLSIFLALALAAPVFTGCDNGLDEYKSGETIAPPSDKFKAEIQFVSRLTDGALAGSAAIRKSSAVSVLSSSVCTRSCRASG